VRQPGQGGRDGPDVMVPEWAAEDRPALALDVAQPIEDPPA
jgi:hypothetical protein